MTNSMTRMMIIMILSAYILLHGLPLIVLQIYGMDLAQLSSESYFLTSAACLLAYIFGIIASPRFTGNKTNWSVYSAISRKIVYATFPIIFPWSIYNSYQTFKIGYGLVDPIDLNLNILMYIPLTVLPVIAYDFAIKPSRKNALFLLLIIAPRLLISIFGPRFFLFQALIPVIMIYYSLNKIDTKWVMKITAVFLFVTAIIPILRGDGEVLLRSLVVGSPINLIRLLPVPPDDKLSLFYVPCAFSDGTIAGECTSIARQLGASNFTSLDQMMTASIRLETGLNSIGTGGNPFFESGAFSSILFAGGLFVITGIIIGIILKNFLNNIFFLLLMSHVPSKALFLLRGNFLEFYDRLLYIATAAIALKILSATLIRRTR